MNKTVNLKHDTYKLLNDLRNEMIWQGVGILGDYKSEVRFSYDTVINICLKEVEKKYVRKSQSEQRGQVQSNELPKEV